MAGKRGTKRGTKRRLALSVMFVLMLSSMAYATVQQQPNQDQEQCPGQEQGQCQSQDAEAQSLANARSEAISGAVAGSLAAVDLEQTVSTGVKSDNKSGASNETIIESSKIPDPVASPFVPATQGVNSMTASVPGIGNAGYSVETFTGKCTAIGNVINASVASGSLTKEEGKVEINALLKEMKKSGVYRQGGVSWLLDWVF